MESWSKTEEIKTIVISGSEHELEFIRYSIRDLINSGEESVSYEYSSTVKLQLSNHSKIVPF